MKEQRLSSTIKTIKEMFIPIMDKWEVEYFDYIHKLKTNLKEWKEENKPERGYINIHVELRYRDQIGYTKAMQELLMWSDEEQKIKIHKMAQVKLKKVDVAVAKKLKDIKVEKIKSVYMRSSSADGYAQGCWTINDTYYFEFHVIYAGGYNIQCLHYRTIYKLNKIKKGE